MNVRTSNKSGFTLVEIMIVVAIIGLLAAIAIPNFVRARTTSQMNACINNLRQIDGAKQQWALETKQQPVVTPTYGDILGFLKNAVSCPSAGTDTTFGSSYDTVLTVYTGGCGTLTEVACNDDVGDVFQHSRPSSQRRVHCLPRPHAGNDRLRLRKAASELCFSCHAAQVKDDQGRMLPATKSLFEDKGASLHPPFATGKCSVCHQPHASASGRLLGKGYPTDFYARYTKENYGACVTCHSSKKFEEPRALTETQLRNGNLNLHHRHVNRDKGRSCGACHSPHGSTQPKLIHPNFQFGEKCIPPRGSRRVCPAWEYSLISTSVTASGMSDFGLFITDLFFHCSTYSKIQYRQAWKFSP